MQLLRDILEVDERVDVEESLRLLRLDVAIHIGLESVAKLPHVAPAQRQSCRVGMAAEVEQQVAAALDGRVDIKSRHAPSRSCRQVSLARDDHGGAEVDLCQSAGHDAHHALLPVFVVEDDAALVALALQSVHDQVGLVRHLSVYALSLLVVRVYVACPSQRFVDIPLHEQVHALLATLHASAGVDARSYLEDNLTH